MEELKRAAIAASRKIASRFSRDGTGAAESPNPITIGLIRNVERPLKMGLPVGHTLGSATQRKPDY